MSVSRNNSVSIEEQSSTKRKKNRTNWSIVKYITILHWLPKYSLLDGVSDLVAGITLGLAMIPQSIAYAALAGLTAQYGLYSCLLGGFIYLIFGGIREVSIGPSSLMALLTLEYTMNMPVDFVVLFCFLCGCIELMMGMLRLGFIVDFISVPVTSGFTSATSVIIIISQIQGLLGLKFQAHNVVSHIINLVENIGNAKLPDIYLGFSSIAFLLAFRKLKDIDCFSGKNGNRRNSVRNIKMKKIFWFVSICRNVLVILITAVIAYSFKQSGSTPFTLSGKVVPGLPTVSLPPFSSQVGNRTYTFFDMCSHYGPGLIVLPLVSVLANVAIAKAFACGSTVNATQEMLTLGLCNILGSFVSSMPSTGAFTRSALSSASGIRTPMAGLYIGIMTILALSFLTPYFYYIPRATLAAVLITAVVFIIDLDIFKLLWKGSKRDAIAAIVTFLISIICGVEIGLMVGAFFNLIFFLRPSARPQIDVIECKTQLGKKYVVLKPDTGLAYPAVDYFCATVIGATKKYEDDCTVFVINCERLRDIDYTVIKGIEKLSKDLNANRDKLCFLHVAPEIVQSIEILADKKNFRFINNEEGISYIYHDDTVINDIEGEIKEKLLEDVIKHRNPGCDEINGKRYSEELNTRVLTTSEDHTEEIGLMSTQLPKIYNNDRTNDAKL